jgi:hypothetical protein
MAGACFNFYRKKFFLIKKYALFNSIICIFIRNPPGCMKKGAVPASGIITNLFTIKRFLSLHPGVSFLFSCTNSFTENKNREFGYNGIAGGWWQTNVTGYAPGFYLQGKNARKNK